FLAATMGKQALYPMQDPMARVNVQASRVGEELNWHFERSELTTTLLLQAPQEAGELEYRKALHSAEEPTFARVPAVLRGKDPEVRKAALKPGALNVFRGVNTLHRVVPVRGNVERIVAIFAFFDRPGVVMTANEQVGFYGRSVAAASSGGAGRPNGQASALRPDPPPHSAASAFGSASATMSNMIRFSSKSLGV